MANINVDKLLAYIDYHKEECKKRLLWAKTEREKGEEEGYFRCLNNLAFHIGIATRLGTATATATK